MSSRRGRPAVTLRCACYHRVSTARQNRRGARAELQAAARRRGYAVTMTVEEIASTTHTARGERPGLAQVLAAARSGKIDAVLVLKLDRLGRSLLELLETVRELRALGVRVVSVTQPIDLGPKDSAGDLVLNVLASAAEFERDIIRERTLIGLENARANGSKLGRPRSADGPDPLHVDELRLAGFSWAMVAAELRCDKMAARRAAGRQ